MMTFLAFACLILGIYLGNKTDEPGMVFIYVMLFFFSVVLFGFSMLLSP